jgi:hypothetical protein
MIAVFLRFTNDSACQSSVTKPLLLSPPSLSLSFSPFSISLSFSLSPSSRVIV